MCRADLPPFAKELIRAINLDTGIADQIAHHGIPVDRIAAAQAMPVNSLCAAYSMRAGANATRTGR